MRLTTITSVLLLGLGMVACGGGDNSTSTGSGSSSSSDNGGSDQTTAPKDIQREQIADNRFKPLSLENTIDELVSDIEAAKVSEDLSLGVVLKELVNFWRPVSVGANRALSELEIVGSVQGTTQESLTVPEEVKEQIAFVKEQQSLNYDGLAIAPHNEELIPLMNEFSDQGKPVVTIDSDLPDSERDLYIGTDNAQGGTTGGQTLVDTLDGTTGRVLILGNTDPSWVDGYVRTNAAKDVLEAAGNTVEIIGSLWTPDEEVAQVAEYIADDSSGLPLVGMLGVFSNAHAMATAAVDANLDPMPKIVAFDFEPETLDYMQDGTIQATHVQRQYYMGYLSVYLLYSINAVGLDKTKATVGDHLLKGFHLDTGLDVIHATDLEEYNSFVDDLGI